MLMFPTPTGRGADHDKLTTYTMEMLLVHFDRLAIDDD